MMKIHQALEKKLNELFSESEIEELEFYTDVATETTYSWRFQVPGESVMRILTYHKKSKKVTEERGEISLNEQIEKQRKDLTELIAILGKDHPAVFDESRRLDDLINKKYNNKKPIA